MNYDKTVVCNKFNTGMFFIFDNVKIDSISLIGEFNYNSNYNLIKLFNRDGYILDVNKSMGEITQTVTFYTEDFDRFRKVFQMARETAIYFNNLDYFYMGFISNIKTSKFKHKYKEVVITFVLQPFCYKNAEEIVLNSSGTINNKGDFETRPIMEITPVRKKFSISIGYHTMEFDFADYPMEKLFVDLENLDIKNFGGDLRNSVFTGGNYLKLDVGVNPVVLDGISSVSFRCNWRYLYYDIS